MFVDDFSLPLPPPLTNSTDGSGLGQLLTFILSPLLLLFLLTLSSPFSPPSLSLISPLSSLFYIYVYIKIYIYTLSFSLPFLSVGHIHLLIVIIAVRSCAMACRKSELVHVSEHRYAPWTPAGSFTRCWSEEGDACMHGLRNKAPSQTQGNDTANNVLFRVKVKCPKTCF